MSLKRWLSVAGFSVHFSVKSTCTHVQCYNHSQIFLIFFILRAVRLLSKSSIQFLVSFFYPVGSLNPSGTVVICCDTICWRNCALSYSSWVITCTLLTALKALEGLTMIMKNFNRCSSHGHHGSKRRGLAQYAHSHGSHAFTHMHTVRGALRHGYHGNCAY